MRTTVSDGEITRRKRYEPGTPTHGITANKERLLLCIAECRMLTTDQVARMAGVTKKAAYKHLRDLFDLGLLGRVAVPYADLAPPEKDGPSLVWGPGENVHIPTKDGLRWLAAKEYIADEDARRKPPEYGPRNKLFLAHELLVRDVRVWLELCARSDGGSVERSVFGTEAHILPARQGGWFLYRVPSGGTAVLMAEADRGNQFGNQWKEKARSYSEAVGSEAFREATKGRSRGRILAVALDAARRDWIAGEVAGFPAAEWTHCCVRSDLEEGGLSRPFWRRPGKEGFHPLLPEDLIKPG